MNDTNKKLLILQKVLDLPHNISKYMHRADLIDLVLHHISGKQCLNFLKSAYLLDNSEFDCCKGMAGFIAEDSCEEDDSWDDECKVDQKSKILQSNQFNNQIKQFRDSSLIKNCSDNSRLKSAVVEKLCFSSPKFLTWNAKHDNHGILVWEDNHDSNCEEILKKICPILGMAHF